MLKSILASALLGLSATAAHAGGVPGDASADQDFDTNLPGPAQAYASAPSPDTAPEGISRAELQDIRRLAIEAFGQSSQSKPQAEGEQAAEPEGVDRHAKRFFGQIEDRGG